MLSRISSTHVEKDSLVLFEETVWDNPEVIVVAALIETILQTQILELVGDFGNGSLCGLVLLLRNDAELVGGCPLALLDVITPSIEVKPEVVGHCLCSPTSTPLTRSLPGVSRHLELENDFKSLVLLSNLDQVVPVVHECGHLCQSS